MLGRWDYDAEVPIQKIVDDGPACCLAQRLQVPSVDAGVFSVVKKSTERAEDATRLWNPSCYDTMSFDGGYSDLIRGALSDVANAELGAEPECVRRRAAGPRGLRERLEPHVRRGDGRVRAPLLPRSRRSAASCRRSASARGRCAL